MMVTNTMQSELTRPIVGIKNRTAQEVFDIMCDRFKIALSTDAEPVKLVPAATVKAEELARQIWGYFKGDSTGSATAMQWFDNNKSLGGPAHVIELCLRALSNYVDDGSCSKCGCAPRNKDGLCATCADESAPPAGWQSMKVAPRDGTEIILRVKDGYVSCSWDHLEQEWSAGWLGIGIRDREAIGWAPLPAALATKQATP